MPTVKHSRRLQTRRTLAAKFADVVAPLSGAAPRTTHRFGFVAAGSYGMCGTDSEHKPGGARFGRDDP